MLIKLGLVAEADVRPFFVEFARRDHDGSGILDKHDLAHVAEARRVEEERREILTPLARRAKEPSEWARRLFFPSALALINFIWHSWFGYALLASGLANALVVRLLMGYSPSRGTLHAGAALAIVAALFVATAFVLMLFWAPITVGGQRAYFHIDQMGFDLQSGGAITENGLLVQHHRTEETIKLVALDAYEGRSAVFLTIFGTYLAYFPMVIILDIIVAFKCIRVSRELATASETEICEMREVLGRNSRGYREDSATVHPSISSTGNGLAWLNAANQGGSRPHTPAVGGS